MSRITEVIHIGKITKNKLQYAYTNNSKTQWSVMHIVLYIINRHQDINLEFV